MVAFVPTMKTLEPKAGWKTKPKKAAVNGSAEDATVSRAKRTD